MQLKSLAVLTAAIVACAAPAASARPAVDPPAQTKGQRTDLSTIAAHHDAISQAQWEQAARQPEVALIDATDPDDGFPTLLVVLGISVPLGLVLLQIIRKTGVAYRRGHRTA
jgi:hypothetical protein